MSADRQKSQFTVCSADDFVADPAAAGVAHFSFAEQPPQVPLFLQRAFFTSDEAYEFWASKDWQAHKKYGLVPELFCIEGGLVLPPYHIPATRTGKILSSCARNTKFFERSPDIARADASQASTPEPVDLGREVMILGPGEGFNYSHWLIDCLPRVDLFLRRFGRWPEKLLLTGQPQPYKEASLAALGCTSELIHNSQPRSFTANKIWFTTATSSSTIAISPLVLHFWDCFANYVMQGRTSKFGRRLYISRDDARMRRVVNESEILEALQPFGVERIALRGLDFLAQAAAFRGADLIIAPHGAGLTNLLFSSYPAKVIELFPENFATASAFRHISERKGLIYGLGAGRNAEIGNPPENRNFHFDPGILRQMAGDMLSLSLPRA